MDLKKTGWLILVLLIIVLAGYFRLTGLELKAVHHDESVNYAFTKKLLETGEYAYNPTAYHGPLLYYLGLPAPWIGGFSKTTLRLMPAIFGLFSVLFLLLMHRFLGKTGAIFAALVLALSPADVYFSKTFIHEIYFAFTAAALFWAFLYATREAKPLPIVAFWVFLALSFTVKETAAFAFPAFALALLVGWLAGKDNRDQPFHAGALLGSTDSLYLVWGIGLGLTVWLLMFTSFLSNPQGIPDFFRSYMPWFKTGVVEKPHAKSWTYFFILVGKYYLPALPFALWATIRGIWRSRPQTLALLSVAVVMQGVYSVVPYKTPWCVLTLGLAWLMLAADGFSDLWEFLKRTELKIALAILVAAGLVVYGLASYRLNFEEYDDDKGYRIVYVQTLRGYEKMPEDLARVAQAAGLGNELPVYMTLGSKNPGRFYLRDYPNLETEKHEASDLIDHDVVIVRNKEYGDIQPRLSKNYQSITYPVFPGWWIYLLVEDQLWQKAGLDKQEQP